MTFPKDGGIDCFDVPSGKVYRIRVPNTVEGLADHYNLLDEVERSRAACFTKDCNFHKYVYRHSCYRKILSLYTDSKPEELVLDYGEFNKPYLVASNIKFNTSSSGEYALIGLSSEHELGLDIEKIDDSILNKDDLFAIILSDEEKQILSGAGIPFNSSLFYKIWTSKEALLKCIGTGMNLDMKSVTVLSERGDSIMPCLDGRYSFFNINVGNGYWSCWVAAV